MRVSLILFVVLTLAIFTSKFSAIRRGLVAERNSINGSWSELKLALNRRAELIPELVKVVQKEAPHDSAVQAVCEARTKLDQAEGVRPKIEANIVLDAALGGLLVCAEKYPRIQKSKEFTDSLDAMKESEYHIAVARRKYNEAVEHYNTRLALFPNNLVASVSRFGKIDTYMPAPVDTQTPSRIEY
jgi:LemA protein